MRFKQQLCGGLSLTYHAPARLGAAMADLSTRQHPAIIPELLAAFSAFLTHLGADLAKASVQNRPTQHVVCGRLTEFPAIKHQSIVIGLGMLAALLETVHRRLQTDVVTA